MAGACSRTDAGGKVAASPNGQSGQQLHPLAEWLVWTVALFNRSGQ